MTAKVGHQSHRAPRLGELHMINLTQNHTFAVTIYYVYSNPETEE